MKKPLIKTATILAAIGVIAYCLKRFSDELVVYVSPSKAKGYDASKSDFKEMIGLSFSELDWLLLIFAFIGAFSLMVFGQLMAAVIIIFDVRRSRH